MVTAKDIYTGMRTSLDRDIGNLTLAKKLVINVAPTGSFVTRQQNPNQPYTPREIADNVIEAYEAGASVWHVHCRDANGIPSKDPKVIIETIDMVFARCPDIIISMNMFGDYTKHGVGLISPIVDPLVKAGSKYIQTGVITPFTDAISEKFTLLITESILADMVKYVVEKGIRPEFQIHHYTAMDNVEDWIIRPGIINKPYLINLCLGYHAFHKTSPTVPDPWGYLYLMSMMQALPQGCVIGASVGGRNWLSITAQAILLGVDCVRVGMEDAVFMYPHKDEKIKGCGDVVQKVATIARELGRDIATPSEARKIMGLQS